VPAIEAPFGLLFQAMTDDRLKELAELKQLQSLCLLTANVTDARLKEIEGRLDVVGFIEDGASAAKVRAELRARVTREGRYDRYRNDLMRLAALLRHDAEQDLIRLLDIAYRFRFYRLKIFAGATSEPRVASAAELGPHP